VLGVCLKALAMAIALGDIALARRVPALASALRVVALRFWL